MKEVVEEKPPFILYYNLETGYTHDGKLQRVEAFPNGFQMTAGDNYRRNSSLPNLIPQPLGPWPTESQEMLAERATGFNCLPYHNPLNEATFSRHAIPEKRFLDSYCTDDLRLELMFSSCCNGEMNGGPAFESHLAYPDRMNFGNCLPGFETILATERVQRHPWKLCAWQW